MPSTSTSTRPGRRRRPASSDAPMPAASSAPTPSATSPTSTRGTLSERACLRAAVRGASGGVSSSGPSTPALLTAGLAGATDTRALGSGSSRHSAPPATSTSRLSHAASASGPVQHDRHPVVDRRADLVGLGGQDRRARAVVEPGERERHAAVDRVAERQPRRALAPPAFSHSYQPSASTRQRPPSISHLKRLAAVSERTLIGANFWLRNGRSPHAHRRRLARLRRPSRSSRSGRR